MYVSHLAVFVLHHLLFYTIHGFTNYRSVFAGVVSLPCISWQLYCLCPYLGCPEMYVVFRSFTHLKVFLILRNFPQTYGTFSIVISIKYSILLAINQVSCLSSRFFREIVYPSYIWESTGCVKELPSLWFRSEVI